MVLELHFRVKFMKSTIIKAKTQLGRLALFQEQYDPNTSWRFQS